MPRVRDGLAAGAVAAALSGAPSTVLAVLSGADPLASTRAAGTILLPEDTPPRRLLVAGAAGHVALSLGWGVALAWVLPRRRSLRWGAVAGLGIAAVDLGIVGRRRPAVRRLPLLPQLADHVAFGAVAAYVVNRRRRRELAARTA